MKKKLLVVIKNLDGGTGTFLGQILKLGDDFDIKVCALEKPRFGKIYQNFFLFFSKKPIHLSGYNLNPLLYWGIVRELFWLKKIINDEKPYVVLSIDTHCNILAGLVKKFFASNVKLLLTTHNNLSAVVVSKISPILRQMLKYLGKQIFECSDGIVCVSKGVAEDIKKIFDFKKRVQVIPYGLDLNKAKLQSRQLVDSRDFYAFGDGLKIISVGRFESQKDFFGLLAALAKIKKEIPEVKLILVGDGSQKRELVDFAGELNLQKHVYFLGWKANVYPYLRNSDVFVLSSNYEGFGYVILEAMVCGLPVVSTNTSWGPSEILEGGKYGILTPVGNSKKMAEAIITLLKSDSIRKDLSKKSLERIRFYSEEKMLKSYKKLIESM